jgi:hypothetical protein
MDLDSIEFEKLERNFKIAQEIEEEFISSSDYNK